MACYGRIVPGSLRAPNSRRKTWLSWKVLQLFLESSPVSMLCSTGISNVRYWHKADMPSALHMSAFGGKADIGPRSPASCAER